MTYRPVGAYYQFTPGQVYQNPHYNNGMTHFYSGYGGSCCGALGASNDGFVFNGSQVWADYMTGQKCGASYTDSSGKSVPYGDQASACAAAKNAVDSIRAALGKLGYGALAFGKPWGSADQAAYQRWVDDMSLSPSPAGRGMPAQSHMAVMEKQVNAGETPGPQDPLQVQKVGGEYVRGDGGVSTAGTGIVLLGVLGLAVVGGLVLVSKRRKKTPVTVKA